MATGKQLLNKPLYSVSDGKKLGEIKDLYLDEQLEKVTGVFLGSEGLLSRKNFAIDRAAVQLMGIDAWLVTGTDKVIPPEAIPDYQTHQQASQVRGREIQTEGGTKIGAIEDVIFDGEGKVTGFVLGKVYVQGPLAERKTIVRSAILNVGSKDAAMTANMTQAEAMDIPIA